MLIKKILPLTGLLRYVQNSRMKQLVGLIALMTITAFAEVTSIGAVIPFLAVLTSPEKLFEVSFLNEYLLMFGIKSPTDLLLPVTILFGISALLATAFRLKLMSAQAYISYEIASDISQEIYKRILHQNYSYHTRSHSGELIASITTKASSISHQVIFPFLIIISSTIILLAGLSLLLFVNYKATLIALIGFVLIYALVIYGTKNAINHHGNKINSNSALVIKNLQDGIGGIRDILLNGSQNVYLNEFAKNDLELKRSIATVYIITSSPRLIVEAVSICLIALVAYYTATSSDGLQQAIPTLGAMALAGQRLLPIIQQLYASIGNISASAPVVNDVLKFLSLSIPSADLKEGKKINLTDSICLENISFKYENQNDFSLRNVTLKVRKGQRIGIVGKSGSGKSTLLDLLMGLISPTEGKLIVDGIQIDLESMRDWQSHVAHVPQSIYLCDGSITENIAFGVLRENIDIERVKECCRYARLEETILNLPDKFDTRIGERGVMLSGGQRQRLGIARALYKNPAFLILDEATSALDERTEREVMNEIYSLKKELTILIVAHRVSTLSRCNKIFKLDRGGISTEYN